MKLLHMADLHLGKTVNGMNFIEDQRHVLTQVLELMEKEPLTGSFWQEIFMTGVFLRLRL